MSEQTKIGKIKRVLNSSEVHFNGSGEFCFDYYCGENLNSILRKICNIISSLPSSSNNALPFRISSANFESNGTDYLNDIFQNFQAEIFWNNIPKYINLSEDEWEYLEDGGNIVGVRITTDGFDANTNNYDFIVTLKAKYSVPILKATTVSNVSDVDAEFLSAVKFSGNGTVSEKGVVYSTNPNPTINDGKLQDGSGIGAILINGTGFSQGTTYYVRSYAINEFGVGYGAFTTFTTES